MVCLRLQAVSTPLVDVDKIESGLSPLYGTSYIEGSIDLKKTWFNVRHCVVEKVRSPTYGGG